ncbi:MAG: transposase domain-containing protein [Spirochaetales bacterium]|nr:transposase domain-containing protein [Spirochaetales bacterium]
MGRKNWLFHGNEEAAEASCRIFTLIETAKVNGLEPYAYLNHVLQALPIVESQKNWASLLPWNLSSLGKNCRLRKMKPARVKFSRAIRV